MASVDLNYVGRHGSVLVPMPFGGETAVQWGETLTTTGARRRPAPAARQLEAGAAEAGREGE
jgi:hypothetical protein